MKLTHASWFSGIGGLDLGLERAGWTTVSFSEIDKYASAVLAERWPDVPNLGDIIEVAGRAARERIPGPSSREPAAGRIAGDGPAWQSASLWSAGFPCQDLSIAGRRAGFEGDRSSLAFTFLDLVELYRPRAILFENVPGLLSSHGGRDLARLLREVAELGYGVAWRSLNAQYFGVPQRRLRVFLVALRSEGDDPTGYLAALRAAEVLAIGTSCGRHPAKGGKTREEAAGGPRTGLEIAGGLTRRYGKGVNTTIDDGAVVIGQTPDMRRDGAPDGAARRLDDSPSMAYYVAPETGQGADLTAHEVETAPAITVTEYERSTDRGVRVFTKSRRAQTVEDEETWVAGAVAPTVNVFDSGDTRATTLVGALRANSGGWRPRAEEHPDMTVGPTGDEDPLLPPGLDSNRYRACGNAVVVTVAEWIGHRLRHALEDA